MLARPFNSMFEYAMNGANSQGFTLVEILIVVTIMAIISGAIIPYFTDSTTDAKAGTALTNLRTLRSQIEMYKVQHGDNPPATPKDLTVQDSDGFGPYIVRIPENPLNELNTVGIAASNPPKSSDGKFGWQYHPASGGCGLTVKST